MRSKFTSILMFFIIIAILATAVLIGTTIFDEIRQSFVFETAKNTESSGFGGEEQNIQSNSDKLESEMEKQVEVPKIRSASNDKDTSNTKNTAVTASSKNEEETTSKTNPLDEITQNTKKVKKQEEEQENNTEISNVNRYFYAQLNKYSKAIYVLLEKNKENMKSGTYKLDLGSTFSSILAKENGQEELGNYYQSAIEAYVYDNPEAFYLSPGKMYLNIETTTRGNQKTYNAYIDSGEQSNYFIDEFESKSQVQQAISEIRSIRDKIVSQASGDTYKDVKMAHDYLINNVDYDTTISKANIYNVYGALVNHESVCEGYAKALKYLLDGMGIESTLVIGKGTNSEGRSENHAWNYVKIEDKWYAVDATWDDPIVIGGGFIGNSVKYKYFLKGSSTMEKDHFPSGRFTEGGMVFEYPKISVNDY